MSLTMFSRLICDSCRQPLPDDLPGNALDARARARLDHGWRRANDANGLPLDLCPVCARYRAREAAMARIRSQYGEEP